MPSEHARRVRHVTVKTLVVDGSLLINPPDSNWPAIATMKACKHLPSISIGCIELYGGFHIHCSPNSTECVLGDVWKWIVLDGIAANLQNDGKYMSAENINLEFVLIQASVYVD